MVPSELNSRKRGLLIQGWHWKHVQILQTCNIIVEKSGKSRTKSIKMSHLQKNMLDFPVLERFGVWNLSKPAPGTQLRVPFQRIQRTILQDQITGWWF